MNSGEPLGCWLSAGLVLFMVPGLALFYGGMVSSRNVLVVLQQNIFPLGLITILWILVGYSLAFGHDLGGGLIGNLNVFGLRDLRGSPAPNLHVVVPGVSIPTLAFVVYMMMFAIITPALVTGATADRLKFAGYAVLRRARTDPRARRRPAAIPPARPRPPRRQFPRTPAGSCRPPR